MNGAITRFNLDMFAGVDLPPHSAARTTIEG